MGANSPQKLRSGNNSSNLYSTRNPFERKSSNHENSEQNNFANADSGSNLSESHREEINSASQAEMNHQVIKLQTKMNEIKTLLATLTQQVISLDQRKGTLCEPLAFAHRSVSTHC